MEILKSGDVPALVTNYEVLHILSQSVERRRREQAEIEGERQATKVDKKLQHRDFIEESVYDYLAASPCAGVQKGDMKRLISSLKGRPLATSLVKSNKKLKAHVKLEDGTHMGMEGDLPDTKDSCISAEDTTSKEDVHKHGFGLTDAETMQILNLFPREQVEIHLLIEDLSGRMNEDKQNQLLTVIGDVLATSTSIVEHEDENFDDHLQD